MKSDDLLVFRLTRCIPGCGSIAGDGQILICRSTVGYGFYNNDTGYRRCLLVWLFEQESVEALEYMGIVVVEGLW